MEDTVPRVLQEDAACAGCRVEAVIALDEMSAQVEVTLESLECYARFSPREILQELKLQGLCHGIHEQAIEAAFEEARKAEKLQFHFLAAKGDPAPEGAAAKVELLFTPPERGASSERRVVTAGERLAFLRISPVAAGCTVTGKILPPPIQTKPDEKLLAGLGTVLAENGTVCLVAEGVVGYADLREGKICVEDPIRFSKDLMSAELVAHPPDSSGRMITFEEILGLLEQKGVSKAADRKVVQALLAQVKAKNRPYRGIIAHGVPPEEGKDGEIRQYFLPEILPGTVEEETARMDLKERGALKKVKKGDLLAEILPPVPGKNGYYANGQLIPCKPVQEAKLQITGMVTVSEDGLRYTASENGVVSLGSNGRLGVFKEYTVPGDVDYSTGNLDMDGLLRIKGWVRSGFTVKATGDIVVEQGVEEAFLESETNIRVQGGILGGDAGRIKAEGDVQARFINHVQIQAGGNVSGQSILHSQVFAEGRIHCLEGKGGIIGGTAVAGECIQTLELGSKGGEKTWAIAGIRPTALVYMSRCEKSLDSLRRAGTKIKLAHANKAGGSGGDTRIAKLRREEALQRAQIDRLRKRALSEAPIQGGEEPSIEVRKAVYEGTVVNIRGCVRIIQEGMGGGRFLLNNDEWAVDYLNLNG